MRLIAFAFLVLLTLSRMTAGDAAPVLVVSTDTPTVTYSTWTTVDAQLSVTDIDGATVIDGARVFIDDLVSGDLLRVNPALNLAALGLASSYSGTTGVLSINGNGAADVYQNVLRAVQISAVSSGDATRSISFALGQAVAFTGSDHAVSHYYRFIAADVTWAAAKAAASGSTYFGLQGYLATITTATENDFIRQKLGGDAWIGASDDVATVNAAGGVGNEGDWHWVTGPEAGTMFSTGNVTPAAVGARYMNWNNNEPNDSGAGEHYCEIFNTGASPGRWNDLDGASGGSVTGYVIEYGSTGGDPVITISKTRTLALAPSNTTPSFTKGGNITVNEDAGGCTYPGWATAISPGAASESSQIVDFIIDGNTNAGLFSQTPTVSPDGTLSFTPAADANGTATITLHIHDNGGTADGGTNASATQQFTITVTAVNDVPSFTIGARVNVTEDAGAQTRNGWATSISQGPADEAAQTLTFTVAADHTELFSVQPALSSAGVLTFTPAANAAGIATITVTLADNAGGQSAAQTAIIGISEINDTPSFTKGGNITVNEDAGLQTIPGWATAISPGPASEAAQVVDFIIDSNTNAPLFSQLPAVDANGTLSFTPAADANGVATVTLHIHDDGGTVGGGSNASATQNFTITVSAVNDTPGFTIGARVDVAEDCGAQTSNGWATSISQGPADEAAQTLTFTVTADHTELFSVQPALSGAGALTFTPAASAAGTATITVTLADNAGG